MRRQQQVFLITFVIGASLLVLATNHAQPLIGPRGASTHYSRFGSSGIGSIGWLMPASSLMSTTHTANSSLSGFMVAKLNVFPYQIQPGTVLYLSLYLNGQLASTEKYELSGSYTTPATVVGTIAMGVAKFSNSMLGFTVSQFPLNTMLPAGTTVTVLAWSSNPIWVQIDSTMQIHSYEILGVASYLPPSVVTPETGTICAFTLSVGLESSAE